jgi:hypothetical protein
MSDKRPWRLIPAGALFLGLIATRRLRMAHGDPGALAARSWRAGNSGQTHSVRLAELLTRTITRQTFDLVEFC